MGMEFRVLLVWKRVWKMTVFLVWNRVKNLGNREEHPHQEFPGVPPPPPRDSKFVSVRSSYCIRVKKNFWLGLQYYFPENLDAI